MMGDITWMFSYLPPLLFISKFITLVSIYPQVSSIIVLESLKTELQVVLCCRAVANHSGCQNNVNAEVYSRFHYWIPLRERYYSSIKSCDVPLTDLKFKIFVETDKWKEWADSKHLSCLSEMIKWYYNHRSYASVLKFRCYTSKVTS